MLPFLTLAACIGSTDNVGTEQLYPRAGDVVDIDVVAHIDGGGLVSGWTDVATVGTDGPGADQGGTGRCVPVRVQASSQHTLARVDLGTPVPTSLRWIGDAYASTGPRRVGDPGWAVGDVRLVRIDGTVVAAAGALRFGGIPEVLSVTRDANGGIALRWKASADERLIIRTVTPSGQTLDCSAGPRGGSVPRWAAPADGGNVTLRSIRDRVTVIPNEAIVRVHSAIERFVPLDVPLTTVRSTPEQPPARALLPASVPSAPRHSGRLRSIWG